MRDAVLFLIVGILSGASLLNPRVGICGYIWFGLMRPDVLAWSYGQNNYSFVLAIATMLGAWRSLLGVAGLLSNPIFLPMIILQGPILCSVVFALDPQSCYAPYSLWLRISAMAIVLPLLVQTEEWLVRVLLTMTFSLGILGSKFGLSGILHGGAKFVQGYGGFLSDNNQIALAFACCVPLCWFGMRLVSRNILKLLLVVMAVCTMAAIVMTHSRGGVIALGAVLVCIWMRSRRKFFVLPVLFIVSAFSIYLVRDSFLPRIGTLADPTQEKSASNRIKFAGAALRIGMDYPVFGVGFGTYNQMAVLEKYTGLLAGGPQVIHNTYLQMLTDSGIFACLLFTGWLFGTILWLGRSARRFRKAYPDSPLAAIPIALQASLIGFSVGAFFLSRVEFDLVYFLLMSAASWYVVERNVATREVVPEPEPLGLAMPAWPALRTGSRI